MYKIDDIGSTFISLPPNMQTVENECFFYAVDRQISKIYKIAEKLNIWGDLDNVDPKYYDFLASCIQAPYYKSDYTNEQKLKLLKNTLSSYRYAGTVRGVEELLQATFGNAEFIPWYKYGGEPYHFKVKTTKIPSEEDKKLFEMLLKKVKAARSILDFVEVYENDLLTHIYIGASLIAGEEINIGKGEYN